MIFCFDRLHSCGSRCEVRLCDLLGRLFLGLRGILILCLLRRMLLLFRIYLGCLGVFLCLVLVRRRMLGKLFCHFVLLLFCSLLFLLFVWLFLCFGLCLLLHNLRSSFLFWLCLCCLLFLFYLLGRRHRCLLRLRLVLRSCFLVLVLLFFRRLELCEVFLCLLWWRILLSLLCFLKCLLRWMLFCFDLF